MTVASAPILSTLLALAAFVTGLALLVQVFQEVYKHLTSSKARTYRKVLEDFAGPWLGELLGSDRLADLTSRSPFQLWRWSPTGKVLPMTSDELARAAERVAPAWTRRALEALRTEAELQGEAGSDAKPSPSWTAFLDELWAASKGSPGYLSAVRVQRLLERWRAVTVSATRSGPPQVKPRPLDAARLATALRRELVPQAVHIEAHGDQLERNFEFAYRRRNLRQTFTFAVVLALACNLPIDHLWQRASAIPLEEAVALAERAHDLGERIGASTSSAEPTERPAAGLDIGGLLLDRALDADSGLGRVNYLIDPAYARSLVGHPWYGVRYLLGCLVTALLVTFGAPLLNDLAGAVLKANRGASRPARSP